jgi:hypothetical protein
VRRAAIVDDSHAGRANQSLDNTSGDYMFDSPVAVVHLASRNPMPQPRSAKTDAHMETSSDDDSLGYDPFWPRMPLRPSSPDPRIRVDDGRTWDEDDESTIRFNGNVALPLGAPISELFTQESYFDPMRTRYPIAFTTRDTDESMYLMVFTGQKARPAPIRQQAFGQGNMVEEDMRINRRRPFPESWGDTTGEGCE